MQRACFSDRSKCRQLFWRRVASQPNRDGDIDVAGLRLLRVDPCLKPGLEDGIKDGVRLGHLHRTRDLSGLKLGLLKC